MTRLGEGLFLHPESRGPERLLHARRPPVARGYSAPCSGFEVVGPQVA